MFEMREVTRLTASEYDQLTELLVAVVDDGASIGFWPPLAPSDAAAYWHGVLGPTRVLVLAEESGRIIGSAQLYLEPRENGKHRAEVNKVMVHPVARRRGLGRALMEQLEQIAHRHHRTLLVLDTREGDPSNEMYRGLGFQEVGKIPGYVLSERGELQATVVYYKQLAT